MKKYFHIIGLVFVLLSLGCGGDSSDKTEGIIMYKVTYPKMDKGNFMMDFMPDKMVLKFKDDKYVTVLSAGMGMFKSSFVIDQENDQFSQMVKLINKKYALTLQGKQIPESIDKLPAYTIEKTGETKKILGYNCKMAIVTVDNESHDAFQVFYTDDIEISNPNWCTPFKEIDGVLLEYQYEKYDVCMKFQAKKIKFTTIDDSEFDIDQEYKMISEVEMDKEMKEIFDSFN